MSLILSGTDGLSDVDGTAAAPAIRGTDTNTGIFFPAADQLAASVNGVEGMRLTSTGLGIGTSLPAAKLDVNGNFRFANFSSGSTSGFFGCADTGSITLNFGGTTTPQKGRIFYSDNSDLFSFFTNSTERMRLDSSGNLGLGVTPSAWISSGKAIDIAGFGSVAQTSSGSLASSFNAYQNSAGNWIYKTTNPASQYQVGLSGTAAHAWYTAPSGTANNPISFTQAMTLDASARLTIGYTSASNAERLGASGTVISTGQSINTFAYDQAGFDYNTSTKEGRFFSTASGGAGFMSFYTGSGSERARIDSSGNVGIGTSSPTVRLQTFTSGVSTQAFFESGTGASVIRFKDSTTTDTFAPQFGSAGNSLFWQIAGSEQMRLTSTGLGIGTSSPVAKLHVRGATNGNLLVRGGASAASGLTGTALSSINDAASATASLTFEGTDFYFVQNNAVKATLDSSGNLGLGVTPSAWGANNPAIQMGGGNQSSFIGLNATAFGLNAYFDGTNWRYLQTGGAAALYSQAYAGGHRWFTAPSGTAGNAIPFTQAMTLTSQGYLLLANTSDLGAGVLQVNDMAGRWCATFAANNPVSGTYYHLNIKAGESNVGSITSNTTTTTYATSSDYRLKENIAPMTGALAKVTQLKPVTYTWKADGSAGEGFIAHELAEVCPAAVTGEKDAVDADGKPQYQGIDVSFLVGTLTAAIQELKAMNDTLTARVAQLEAK